MSNKKQVKINAAVEKFCAENPNLFFSKEENRWLNYDGKFFKDASYEFNDITHHIWEEAKLLHNVHLLNLQKQCKIKKQMPFSLNNGSELLLNTPDGVIDFNLLKEVCQAGKNPKEHISDWIHPHEEYYKNGLTNITGASYINNSLPPQKFIAFVNDLFQNDMEQVGYFLKFLTYCLTGNISQQFFHILYGIGRNGKSTLLKIISSIFGTYYCVLNNDIIKLTKDDNKAQRILYQNRSKRMILFNELTEKFKLNLSLIKQVTGDDVIPAHINRNDMEFKGQFKLLFNTNFIPSVGAIENQGIWDRLRVLITRPPIPEGQRIDEFFKSIIDEKDQIMTYLIDNFLNVVLDSGCLKDTPKIMVLTKAYKKFCESPVHFFFRFTIIRSDVPFPRKSGFWIQASELYDNYKLFHLLIAKAFDRILNIRATSVGSEVLVPPVTQTRFGREMHDLGATKTPSNVNYYDNICFSKDRVYSELSERIDDKDLEDFKLSFINLYEDVYIRKQRIDGIIEPYKQAHEMLQMLTEPFDCVDSPAQEQTLNGSHTPPFPVMPLFTSVVEETAEDKSSKGSNGIIFMSLMETAKYKGDIPKIGFQDWNDPDAIIIECGPPFHKDN